MKYNIIFSFTTLCLVIANPVDEQYLSLVDNILQNGEYRQGRNGGVLSIFAPPPLVFDVSHEAFPLITTKKVNFRMITEELLWMLSGSSYVNDLQAKNVNIWNANANGEGRAGFYGQQWRYSGASYHADTEEMARQEHVDQIANAVHLIMHDPTSRRIMVSAWNPLEIQRYPDVLPPCHVLFQFYVRDNAILDMMVIIRSNDQMLGQPYNLASHSLLLLLISHVTDKKAGKLTYIIGDSHIYENHLIQMKEQITRKPYPLPQLYFDTDIPKGSGMNGLLAFKYEDMKLLNYEHHPPLYGKLSV